MASRARRNELMLAAALALVCLPTATGLHSAGVLRPALPGIRPAALPALRVARVSPIVAADLAVPAEEPEAPKGIWAKLPPKTELQKMVPLTMMFFSILFVSHSQGLLRVCNPPVVLCTLHD